MKSVTFSVPATATDAYENLRKAALATDGRYHHAPGWAVLVRRGMAEWLRTLSELPPPANQQKTANIVGFASGLRDEVVRVLTGMIIDINQEVNHAT